jgi:hypothetical protein
MQHPYQTDGVILSKCNSNIAAAMNLTQAGDRRGLSNLGRGLLAGALLAATGAAHAQTTSQTAPPAPADESLTWHGITLYGIVDVDFQYETRGAPFSNFFFSGGSEIVQKNSNNAVSGLTSNGLSQSRIGLQGKEPVGFMDWSGVFKLETFFNPASGQISDDLKSVALNNGRSLANQGGSRDRLRRLRPGCREQQGVCRCRRGPAGVLGGRALPRPVTPALTAAIAYCGEKQNAYATGADANCSSLISGKCSGNLNVASVSLVYHFSKRFDGYGGAMWSNVSHGLANEYLETTMIDPTIGLRFSF